MTAPGVVHAVGDPRRLVATLDDLGLAVAVEVDQGRGREVAVRREPGEPGQGGAGGGVERVLLLAQRRGHRVECGALKIPERQRCSHSRGMACLGVTGRVLHGHEPALGGIGVERLVPAGLWRGRVADAHEDGVIT